MGTEGDKKTIPRSRTFSYLRKHYISEFSLASLAGKFSGLSSASAATLRSTSSTSRPWSRVSRKAWKDSTLENSYQCVKTAWPVPITEAVFLPEFKIQLTKESEYEVLRDDCVSQVKDEVKIQLMCGHHPFIIKSPSYWQNRRKLFIVSEYLDGGDLFGLVERYGSLPEELVKIYITEIASAIDFLHNAGVIYRDLKPENILLDSDGHAILIDFGLSKWLRHGHRTTTLCGTLQYMAPEIFTLNGYGHAVDWWALGIVIFYLLTTKLAGGGNSKSPGELPPGHLPLSAGALDLVTRLLVPDPARRLRAFYTLQTLTFFMGFDFNRVKAKQVRPREILEKHFPDGPKNLLMADSNVLFFDLEDMNPVIV